MIKNNLETEICCFSLHSALIAHKVSSDRIELCGGFLEGGTTPSHGLIKEVIAAVSPKVFVMIRPRGGDFCYSDTEVLTVYSEINSIKQLKPAGFVFGALRPNGSVDKALCKKVIELAAPYPVTFHRAFDQCPEPLEALEDIIALGFERILTSGQKPSALEGLDLLKKLKKIAKDRIQIMAGAGVNTNNLPDFIEAGIKAVHFSAKAWVESSMKIEPNVDMQSGVLPDTLGRFETSLENAISLHENINPRPSNITKT